MMRFEKDRNYIWLFILFATAFLISILAGEIFTQTKPWPVILLPLMMGLVLLIEFRSKVVLDSWWKGRYIPGDSKYTFTLVWHAVGFILFSMLAMFMLT